MRHRTFSFANKVLQVKLVDDAPPRINIPHKQPPSGTPSEPEVPVEDAVIKVIQAATRFTMKSIATYMVCDTARQITIYKALNKVG